MAEKFLTKNKGTLIGTDQDDLLEVWAEQGTVLGQNGDDQIDICQGGNHRIFGGDGNDRITLLKGIGDSVKVYGDVATKNEKGESINENKCSIDTITVNGGNNHLIYGGYFGDTINITSTAGNNIEVNAGSGADKIYVHGGRKHSICGDEGPDTILLTTALNTFEKERGVFAELSVDGGTGEDVITVNGGSGHSIAGGAGPDTITVTTTAGNNMGIDGGSGKDTLTVNSGTGHTIVGGAGPDTITIATTAGNNMDINGGTGEDTIIVNGGTGHVIAGDKARDTITINSGSGYTIDGGSAADTITLKNVWDSKVAGGSEKDFIRINGGSGNRIHGGSGDDDITVNDGEKHIVYGEVGNDIIRIKSGLAHEAYGGDGDDTLYGGTGQDTLTGGADNDTFVYGNGQGNDTITDYTASQDVLQISSGSISGTALANSNKDLVFTVGSGNITLNNASTKVISLKDSRGSYTASNTAITLGSDFTGTMDAAKYLSTVKTIDGRNATKTVNITGNAQNNIIYAGKAGGTVNGGAGNDTLYGGAGNDTLTGGAGNDTFVYGNGQGNDTITDYTAGQDVLQVSSGSVSGTALANSNKDIVFTVGSGNITLNNAATKVISLKDSRGSYTASNTAITLGSDFTGTMDTTKYLSTVKTIDGRNTTQKITITGNGNDNIIYASDIAGNTYFGGIGNDTIYGGSEKDILEGEEGNDYLYGNAGGDELYAGAGNDYLNGGDGDDLLGGEGGDDKLFGGAGDDYLGGGLGNDYLYGEAGDDYIFGESGDDELDGGSGNDYLGGGVGDDRLSGGSGNDTMNGGEGKDTFVFASGYGNDKVEDYTEGQDTLDIVAGIVEKTELANKNKDLIFTVGDGTITLENAAAKKISIKDSYGSYTASDKEVKLGADYTGSFKANRLLSTVTTIDASLTKQAVNVTGNVLDNYIWVSPAGGTYHGGDGNDYIVGGSKSNVTLYGDAGSDYIQSDKGDDYLYGDAGDDELHGGSGNDSLYGGSGNDDLYGEDGNDNLYGGAGSDIFHYKNGNDTIFDYEAGKDTIKLGSVSLKNSEISGRDVVLTLSNGGTITVKNMAGKTIDYRDVSGTLHSLNMEVTQQNIIKNFMKSLDNYPTLAKTRKEAVAALGSAANFASNSVFPTWDALIESFIGDVRACGGSTSDIINQGWGVVPDSGLDNFLKNYCGIDLHNEDTGAIIGADAGGPEVKTPVSIIPENGTISDLQSPALNQAAVFNGLEIHWPEKIDNVKEQYIVNSLNTWWIEEGLNLIEDSFGLSFTEEGVTGKVMDVAFVNIDDTFLARVNWHYSYNYNYSDPSAVYNEETTLNMEINMKYFNEVNTSDVNGYAGSAAGYLDRVIAHELTHATLAATMAKVYNSATPKYFKEGIAELVHGIDDFRTDNIIGLANAENVDHLSKVLQPNMDAGTDSYAGGYMLLRYFAKQSADNYFSTGSSVSSGMLANSVADPITSAVSDLWSEPTAQVADTDGELASSIMSISNAMLTPLDNRNGNMLGLDSPVSGLFSDKNNGLNFLG